MSRLKNPQPLGVSLGAPNLVQSYTPTITQAGNTFSGLTFQYVKVGPLVVVWGVFTSTLAISSQTVSITVPTSASATVTLGQGLGFMWPTSALTPFIPLGSLSGTPTSPTTTSLGAATSYSVTFSYGTNAIT